MAKRCLYGMTAEFDNAEQLLEAAQKARDAGYRRVKAFTPYRVEGLGEILHRDSSVAYWVAIVGLIVGAAIALALQYLSSVDVYPLNVGGRPLANWPAFMIITFELAILFGGLFVAGVMFIGSGLPLPYHPIFNAKNIELASRSHFFLCVEARDPKFLPSETREFLQSLEPIEVSEVQC